MAGKRQPEAPIAYVPVMTWPGTVQEEAVFNGDLEYHRAPGERKFIKLIEGAVMGVAGIAAVTGWFVTHPDQFQSVIIFLNNLQK